MQAKLKFAAQELNLREHVVKGKVLYTACDVEGHRGMSGGEKVCNSK